MKYILYILLLSFSISTSAQQNRNRFGFEEFSGVTVKDGSSVIKNPWTGGINYANMNTMDLNGDGRMDLVVFDKIGPRITTYVDINASGAANFIYAPEYRSHFPIGRNPGFEEDWMLLRDFNCDGKKDLFTGASGKIIVYENISSGNELAFQKAHAEDQLQVQITSGRLDLHVPQTDIPGIIDMDNDGDLDILTFGGSVAFVEWMENKQNCGLDFERQESCWGHFLESGISNQMILDTCTPFKNKKSKGLHAGGTLLPIDLTGDGVKELLVGDVSFNSITALFNTGTEDNAFISSQDTAYPSAGQPIDVERFPACFYEDVDGDNVKDLIISPNQTGFTGSENYKSITFYKNNGSNSIPDFNYSKDNFLQEDQLDLGEGAVPRFADLNGDGLQDLVIANGGYYSTSGLQTTFTYLENTGTATNPEFTLIDSNFINISSYGLGALPIPTFGDLDNDNDLDMIIGDNNGQLHLFTNTGSVSTPSYTLTTAGIGSIDVGNSAAPYLYDMDNDGTLDLLIGNDDGKVYYYSNSSSTSSQFIFESNFFGGINVKNPYVQGFSVPYVFENNGLVNVMVGSGSGIYQYDSVFKVVNQPSLITGTVGTGTLESNNADDSPFGLNKFIGRNQILYTAAELKAQGLSYGFINTISFYATKSIQSPIQKGINVKMKNTSATDLSSFETGLTLASKEDERIQLDSNSWNSIPLINPFLWDGVSNVVIEICFSGNSFRQPLVKLESSNTSFVSNAWGDVVNNNNLSAKGCSLPFLGSSTERPNIMFGITPAFINTDVFLKDGYRNAGAFTDLDGDGFVEAVIGNYAGGVVYFRGEIYDVSIEEPESSLGQNLEVFPNPGNGRFNINTENRSANASISIYDLTGKLILTEKVTGNLTHVNLENQVRGMYLFVLQEGNEVLTQKVIKE